MAVKFLCDVEAGLAIYESYVVLAPQDGGSDRSRGGKWSAAPMNRSITRTREKVAFLNAAASGERVASAVRRGAGKRVFRNYCAGIR